MNKSFTSDVQQDAHEFLMLVMDHISCSWTESTHALKEKFKCKSCDSHIIFRQQNRIFNIAFDPENNCDTHDLMDLLNYNMMGETRKLSCSECGVVTSHNMQNLEVEGEPKFLFMSLLRFHNDQTKINDRVNLRESIQIRFS